MIAGNTLPVLASQKPENFLLNASLAKSVLELLKKCTEKLFTTSPSSRNTTRLEEYIKEADWRLGVLTTITGENSTDEVTSST